jgi:hypothetical protein
LPPTLAWRQNSASNGKISAIKTAIAQDKKRNELSFNLADRNTSKTP